MENINQNSGMKIKTTDFVMTVSLMCYGGKVELEKIANGKYEFTVECSEKINDEWIDNFYANKIRIEPRRFYSNYCILKAMVSPKQARYIYSS